MLFQESNDLIKGAMIRRQQFIINMEEGAPQKNISLQELEGESTCQQAQSLRNDKNENVSPVFNLNESKILLYNTTDALNCITGQNQYLNVLNENNLSKSQESQIYYQHTMLESQSKDECLYEKKDNYLKKQSQFDKFLKNDDINPTHLFACGFYFLGRSEDDYSWLMQQNIINNNWQHNYITSFYFSIITINTIGYGDITPVTTLERIYVSGMITITCAVFGYSINTIGEILKQSQLKHKSFKIQQREVLNYLLQRNVSKQLRIKAIRQLESISAHESFSQGEYVLQKLNNQLKDEIKIDQYGQILFNNKLLTSIFSKPFLEKLCLKMKELKFLSLNKVNPSILQKLGVLLDSSIFYALQITNILQKLKLYLGQYFLNIKILLIYYTNFLTIINVSAVNNLIMRYIIVHLSLQSQIETQQQKDINFLHFNVDLKSKEKKIRQTLNQLDDKFFLQNIPKINLVKESQTNLKSNFLIENQDDDEEIVTNTFLQNEQTSIQQESLSVTQNKQNQNGSQILSSYLDIYKKKTEDLQSKVLLSSVYEQDKQPNINSLQIMYPELISKKRISFDDVIDQDLFGSSNKSYQKINNNLDQLNQDILKKQNYSQSNREITENQEQGGIDNDSSSIHNNNTHGSSSLMSNRVPFNKSIRRGYNQNNKLAEQFLNNPDFFKLICQNIDNLSNLNKKLSLTASQQLFNRSINQILDSVSQMNPFENLFDRQKDFKLYFPNFNLERVLQAYKQKQTSKLRYFRIKKQSFLQKNIGIKKKTQEASIEKSPQSLSNKTKFFQKVII
ncbi:cation channel family protein (macronuclear) [Tetrahymena thermophila SB210]|uniref:Cation channel family protein n=1 Tax=Tetrahymena thermophila (strain SB210) TaxID=312017 RepID=W7XDJ9_TETTS|nr:cation channel family protein [Tetrahymena thermophila SB210]EWS71916.1 cation channel family protein [Tetrahymena thermophila SB210]|eukprot:XP_012655545.1 cation channel family protein [Tetrahymena thermophila SB210]